MSKTEIIKKSLYNGEVEISFYPKSHQYKIDGKNILSVTGATSVYDKSAILMRRAQKLSQNYLEEVLNSGQTITYAEVKDAVMQHQIKKEEAANLGTLAHNRVEEYIKSQEMTIPEDQRVANAIQGFMEWKEQHHVEFIKSELFVYSREHNYCGTTDCLAMVDGRLCLIDFKTSNSIYMLEYGMQTIGYKMAYEEEHGKQIEGVIVLRFSKTEEIDDEGNIKPYFQAREVEDHEGFGEAFLAAKKLREYGKKYDKRL